MPTIGVAMLARINRIVGSETARVTELSTKLHHFGGTVGVCKSLSRNIYKVATNEFAPIVLLAITWLVHTIVVLPDIWSQSIGTQTEFVGVLYRFLVTLRRERCAYSAEQGY